MRKHIKISDFVPPIFLKFLHKIGIFQKLSNIKEPFVSKILGSYSQYHEDLILDTIFNNKEIGSYIDVGANDPEFLNNTKRFYDKGWRGINIEPVPNVFQKLKQHRPNDINLNIGIGPEKGEMTFYQMSSDTLSSFNKKAAIKSGKIHGASIIAKYKVKVLPLQDIFEKHYKGKEVDFLSVDTEGYDIEVLKSNDWKRYRPIAIIVEINQKGDDIIKFLESNNYYLVFNNLTNGIFLDKNNKKLINRFGMENGN